MDILELKNKTIVRTKKSLDGLNSRIEITGGKKLVNLKLDQ